MKHAGRLRRDRRARQERRGRTGATLVETLIAVTITGVVLAALAAVGDSSRSLVESASARQEAEGEARRTIERIVKELEFADETSLVPPVDAAGTSDLDYRNVIGYAAGVPQLDQASRVELLLDEGEADNGVDDDSDGLIDERRLVLHRDAGTPAQKTTVLSRHVRELADGELSNLVDDNGNGLVDEPGFTIALEGAVYTLRVSIERRDTTGHLAASTVETSLRLKN